MGSSSREASNGIASALAFTVEYLYTFVTQVKVLSPCFHPAPIVKIVSQADISEDCRIYL